MSVPVTFVCDDYEWFEPLIHGEVDIEGVDLTVLSKVSSGDRHRRMIAGEFDAAEFSFGTYVTGWPDWDFTAIPVFPRRFFPHSRIMVRADAGITEPTDLEGKRVLLRTYQNTQAVWMKGVLSDRYDLDLDAVDWYALDEEPYRVESPTTPVDYGLEEAYDRISRGDLDALVMTKSAQIFPLPENTKTLFSDLRATEREYYEQTGLYPTMHNVVVRDDLLAEYPWLATELQRAFRRSWEHFDERATYEAKYPLVWWQEYRREETEIFGDIWGRSFELEPNLEEIETLLRYASEQGLVDGQFAPEELFHSRD